MWTQKYVNTGDGVPKRLSSIVRTRWKHGRGWTPFWGKTIFHSDRAVGVALKKAWFGEGAERLVKEFREIDEHNNFVGPILVAKDTKYIRSQEDGVDTRQDEKDFHKVFLKTQMKAQKYARFFSRKLQHLPSVDALQCPRIEFLGSSVYMVDLPQEHGGRQGYLVERMLDIKKFRYRKWNDNAGRVGNTLADPLRFPVSFNSTNMADIMEHENEEDCESESSEEGSLVSSGDSSVDAADDGQRQRKSEDTSFKKDDIPQAFSCFTHWASKRRFLICDLQGVFNTDRSPPVFELTDPVIHHRFSTRAETKHGRTDKGLDGIHKFFASHQCSNLCRMLKSRFLVTSPTIDDHENDDNNDDNEDSKKDSDEKKAAGSATDNE